MSEVSNLGEVAKSLADELETFCGKVFPTRSLPKARFIKDLCTGMAIAKSTTISKISRAISPTKAETKTFMNMSSRHLEMPGLDLEVNRAVAKVVGREIKNETLLLMDPTDISKDYSKGGQEYIAKVHDGSSGEIKDGYSGCMVTACDCGGKKPKPLWFELWSSEAPDFVSENERLLHIIDEVYKATNEKGIIVFDRGADRWLLYREILKKKRRFVIRLVGNRKVLYRGHPVLALTLAKSCETVCDAVVKRIRDGITKTKHISIGAFPIRLPLMKKKERLRMVVIKGFSEEPMMLLTTEIGPKTRKHLERILSIYLTRWRIEDSVRYLKDSYELEDIRLLGYQRLKSMIAILGALFAFLSHHLPKLSLAFL